MSQVKQIHNFFRAVQGELYRHLPKRKSGVGELPFVMVMFDEEGRPQTCSNFKSTEVILKALRAAAEWLEEAREANATTQEMLSRPTLEHPNPTPSQN